MNIRENLLTQELIDKYRFAGKMRLISSFLLLCFLLFMKFLGAYSYLNIAFVSLILVEAFINQPYRFILGCVDIHRFQFYQMAIDIIAISWILYYMGGINAPLVSIAYYVVILWAGVVSSVHAVFFAVIMSVILFSLVVLFEYAGVLPFVSLDNYKMPLAQMLGLLLGNVSFLFAFGYFSARSSAIMKFLERKRYEESLRHVHRFLEAGYLIGSITHDVLNCLFKINGYTEILLRKNDEQGGENEYLKNIQDLGHKSSNLLFRLGKFSQLPEEDFESINIDSVIDDAIELTNPVVRYSKMMIEKQAGERVPFVMANKNSLQEVFIILILNSLDAIKDKGTLSIKTRYIQETNILEIIFSDNGSGIKKQDLKRIRMAESFFTTRNREAKLGLGVSTAYKIIAHHKGTMDVESSLGEGATFLIRLPVTETNRKPE